MASEGWKFTLRQRLPTIGVEFAAIVFGVLLALVVDDWREGRSHEATVDHVLEITRAEVDWNGRELEATLPYHRTLAQELSTGGRRLLSIDLRQHPMDVGNVQSLQTSLERFLNEAGQPTPADFRLMDGPDSSYLMIFGGMPARLVASGDSLKLYGEGNIQLQSANIRNTAWEVAQATQATTYMDPDIVTALSSLYHLQRRHDQTVADILDMLYGGGGSILPALQDLVGYEERLLQNYREMAALIGSPAPADPAAAVQ